MKRILFVCHGNICRSPMAEFVMKKLVDEAGRSQDFLIASAATSTEEIGNGVYPPARRMLAAHGISCEGKTARQITRQDYAAYDIIIGMDTHNIRNMNRIFGGDPRQGADAARPRCGRPLVHGQFRRHLARLPYWLHPALKRD